MGKHDPIHIDLPKGTYVPIFYRNGVEPTLEQSVSETAWGAGSHRRHDEVVRPREGRWYARPTASIVSVAAIVAIGIMAFILIRMLAMDNRPQSGRLEGSTLVVSNTEGKELWRRSFSDGFWADYYEQGVAPRLRFGDLNGDGLLGSSFCVSPRRQSELHLGHVDLLLGSRKRGVALDAWKTTARTGGKSGNLRHTGFCGSETVRQDTSSHRRFRSSHMPGIPIR